MAENVKVYLRCRPLKVGEQESALVCDPTENEVSHEALNKSYTFDGVFTAESSQQDVYEAVVKPLINYLLNGLNCTVFAYGPTGTGKTYTMEGNYDTDSDIGVIPRAVTQIFESLLTRSGRFSVTVSFLELYNEEAYDLLSELDDMTRLRIYEDVQRKNSVRIDGLREVSIKSAQEVFEILQYGSQKRQTTSTLLNSHSSRSHSIFSITLSSRNSDDEEFKKLGKLNLVDLAGSENIARSGAQNKFAREAGNINQSLLTLTRVITALVEKRPHIPYRESKLTRILQDSLGGSTRTSMIATISPAESTINNTLSTLDYASRARRITKQPEQYNNKNSSMQTCKNCSCRGSREDTVDRRELEIIIRNEVANDYAIMAREKEKQMEEYKERIEKRYKEDYDTMDQEIKTLNERLKLVNKLYQDETQKVSDLEIENANLREQLAQRQPHTPEKKQPAIKRVPKEASAMNENDYANLTFDGDDEIVLVSAKKRGRTLGGMQKREQCPLTMSGKKKNLPTGGGDVEISPLSPPKRVTRSRATRKKLNFN